MTAERTIADEEQATPWAALAGIIATVSVFAISQGLTYPLLSILLQQWGESPAMIGASAAMTPLGFIASAPLIPWLSQRVGAARLAILCSGGAAATLVAIGWAQDVWLWFPLRFLLGFFANPLYVISETWLITIAPASRRGRIMGIYTSIVSGGFAVGPLTLAAVGTSGWAPFAVGIAAFLLCGAILTGVQGRLPDMDEEGDGASVAGFVFLAPLLLFAIFAAAAFEQSLLALFPVYGEAYGSAESRVALLMATFIAGNVALQVPLGALAERYGASAMMTVCAVIAVLGSAALPLLFASPLIWPAIFVWGSVAFGIYTMGLIELGERFSGATLITGNAAFAMVWGMGGIVAPPAAGALMNMVGVQGLPLALGLLCAALAIGLAARRPVRGS